MVVKKKSAQKKAVKKVVKKTVKVAKVATKKPVAKKLTAKPAKKTVAKTSSKPVKAAKSKPVKTVAAKKIVAPKVAVKKPLVTKAPVIAKTVSEPTKPPVSAKKPFVKKDMKAQKADAIYDQEIFSDATMKAIQTPSKKKSTTLLGSLEFTPYQPKPDEDYMSDHQKDHFRKILDAWKQQLMQDVDLTVGHLKEEAVFYADPVDRAAQEEGFNLELRTRDRERKLIKKIEQSLDLLNTGEYGYCEDCGAEIGIRRLEARPTAVKCIDCKTFQEIREKQLGG